MTRRNARIVPSLCIVLGTLALAGITTLVPSPFVDSASAQDWLNSRLNSDITSQLQNEQQIVVNPTNPLNLVAVWRDFRLGYRQVGYGYTTDGGRNWINPGLFVNPHYPRDSDPALTVSANGTFYAMLLAYTGSTYDSNGLLMYRSTDGGATWEDRGFAVNGVPNVFEDKEFIACDRTQSPYSGRIYCVWARFYETNIYCVSTGDEGDTWTSVRRVSDNSSVQFPTPAVGPDGTLYVAWTSFGSSRILIDKSIDGGITFGTDRQVASLYNPHPTLNGGIESPGHPAMDIDICGGAYNGRIYIAYLNRDGSSDYDIYIRHSDDGGVNWSSPRRINDDPFNNGRDQFHPWLTVDNTGVVSAVWLDRRHDPQNYTWHCYVSQSFDGGMTWSPNQQVSTMPSSPSQTMAPGAPAVDYEADRQAKVSRGPKLPGPVRRAMAENTAKGMEVPGFVTGRVPANSSRSEDGAGFDPRPDQEESRAGTIGEYIGIAGADGFVNVVWTDTRHGNQDTYAGVDENAAGAPEETTGTNQGLHIFPNPADGPVTLRYEVPRDGWVRLELFNVEGRLVRTMVDRKLRQGPSWFVWDGTDQSGRPVSRGSYWARLEAPGVKESAPVRLHR